MSMNHYVQGGKADVSLSVKDIECEKIILEGKGSVQAFDQNLNTTDDVLFNQLRLTSTMFTDPNQAVNKEYVDQSYPGLASLQIAYTGGNTISTQPGFPLELTGTEGVTVEKTTFSDQDLVTKKFVEDSIPNTTLQDAYDAGNGQIALTLNKPLEITGSEGVNVNSNSVTTTKLTFNNSQELVSKQYVDDKVGIKVVQRFDVLTTTVLYEDDFVKFSWIPGDNQPSYEIKTLPQGQGAFAGYVDVNIIFVGGGNLIGTNDDGLAVLNTKGFFTGNALDPSYTHLNYGSKSICSLSSESDINYPYYKLEVMTGSMQYTGIAVTQRF